MKQSRSNFSFGEWILSSLSPKPTSRESMFRMSLKSATTGIVAPSAMTTGSMPDADFMAIFAADMKGESVATATGLQCPRFVIFHLQPCVFCDFSQAWKRSETFCPCIEAGILKETFAPAKDGMTVLAPSPPYPP